MEASERRVQFNILVQQGAVSKEDEKAHTKALQTANKALLAEIEEKYVKDEEPVATPEAPKEPDLAAQHAKDKATKAYRAFAKTMKYTILKEEVLLECDYTCRCCDKQFESRSTYKPDDGAPYPLFVRSIIPPVQYLLTHEIFDPKVACNDAKLLDPQNYVAICSDCKPVGFKR